MFDSPDQTCEAPDCVAVATHTVTVAIEGEPEAVTHVCRMHDRSLKTYTVRSRTKRPATVPAEQPNVVRCGSCEQVIEELSSLDPTLRKPCPNCLSKSRSIEVSLSGSVSLHDSIGIVLMPGGGPWTLKSKAGDDYTRDLEAWGRRSLHLDRVADEYREVIDLWDGTRIVSEAKLTDHHD